MTLTMSDFFCGAGGSSTGAAQVDGLAVKWAANHWDLAIAVHNDNHPDTDHAIADIHQADPRFFTSTDVGWFSPECTKWTVASGRAAADIDEGLWEDPLADEAAQRSRMLMYDVPRFAEVHRYRLIVVENVVDVATRPKYRHAFQHWLKAMTDLGYEHRVVSLNSMHAQYAGLPAPQSRDRIYVVFWRNGERAPDLDKMQRPLAWCQRCDRVVESFQAWKPGRTIGKYRAQYVYACTTPGCGQTVEPGWLPAAAAIDWSIPGQRIGDRAKPLADKTRARIAAGIARYWGPIHLEAAGQTYDAADPRHPAYGAPGGYYRTWTTYDVLRALHTTGSKALAVPAGGTWNDDARSLAEAHRTMTTRETTAVVAPFMLERNFEYRTRELTDPLSTLTANDTTKALIAAPFIAELRGGGSSARAISEALAAFCASGNHHALVTPYYGASDSARPADQALGTLSTRDHHALVMTNNHTNRARDTAEALPTLTTATVHALLMRNNTARGDQGQMTTPVREAMRTITTAGHQSLITADDLAAAAERVDDCYFRMLEPIEAAAGMAFPDYYRWDAVYTDSKGRTRRPSRRDVVKAAGNAVTPPSSRDILTVGVEALA